MIAVVAASSRSDLAFTLGVSPDDLAVNLYGDRVVCQEPIDVPVAFENVQLTVAGDQPSGPPLAVEVLSYPDRRRLGTGRLDVDYDDEKQVPVRVGRIPDGGRISVCIRVDAGEPVEESEGARVFGGPSQAARSSTVVLDGVRRSEDLTLVFLRDEPASLLSLVPDMLDRAALWRPGRRAAGCSGGCSCSRWWERRCCSAGRSRLPPTRPAGREPRRGAPDRGEPDGHGPAGRKPRDGPPAA